MKRFLVVTLLTACFESHDGTQTISVDDCYLCHAGTYDATSMPVHTAATVGFPTSCADCHRATGWQPALGGLHPVPRTYVDTTGANTTFLLSSHAAVRCLECHDIDVPAPSTPPPRGYNAVCTSCHPNDSFQQGGHVGVRYRSGPLLDQPYTYSSTDRGFCLGCHPTGAIVRHAPNNPFILPHHNARCVTCHDYASGRGHYGAPGTAAARADVRCVTSGCHRESHHAADVPLSCLNAGCHPDGRKHDD